MKGSFTFSNTACHLKQLLVKKEKSLHFTYCYGLHEESKCNAVIVQ